MATELLCKTPGCSRPFKAKGLCQRCYGKLHYKRNKPTYLAQQNARRADPAHLEWKKKWQREYDRKRREINRHGLSMADYQRWKYRAWREGYELKPSDLDILAMWPTIRQAFLTDPTYLVEVLKDYHKDPEHLWRSDAVVESHRKRNRSVTV
jgi:hypothetical protein